MSQQDTIREVLAHCGGSIRENELLYELKRRGIELTPLDLYEAMHDLEQAGEVDSELHFRVKA
jgi:hypothetical protein